MLVVTPLDIFKDIWERNQMFFCADQILKEKSGRLRVRQWRQNIHIKPNRDVFRTLTKCLNLTRA